MAPSYKMDYTSRMPPNPAVRQITGFVFGPKGARLPAMVIDRTSGHCRGSTDDCYAGFQ